MDRSLKAIDSGKILGKWFRGEKNEVYSKEFFNISKRKVNERHLGNLVDQSERSCELGVKNEDYFRLDG